ncbi:MAG: flagellar basal-body MS-ring/collar protein FliF [Bryobacteraceae bacterium]|jgi:flagellar M-ring protein FliF
MDQLIKLFSGLSMRQRISIALAAILTAAGIFAFVRWKRESDFRPLYTAMAPEDAAAVVQKLKETGIDYRLDDNGGSVLAPSSKIAESRLALAAAGLPKTGRIGFELFDKSAFGATEFVEHVNYKRALEGELERTVTSLAEVEQARVHLTLPKESIFLDKQQPAKASVVLKLRSLARISPQNVLAITNLVASAVEGLAPEAVSIVDADGNLLNRPKRTGDNDASEITAEALEVRQQLERDLVAKVVSTVEPLLGPDRFRAGASVECDLTSGEQQEETYDPTHSVMASSQKTEDVSDRASSSGIPGTASNLPGGAGHPAGSGSGTSRRTENVTFQSSRIVRQTHIPQGMIKRMSLSVLVDNTVRWEGAGAARRRILEPPAPETLKTIKDLVAASTGFNAERGDQLIVESLPFESSLNAEPPRIEGPAPKPRKEPPGPPWLEFLQKNRDVLVPVALGIGLVLFLIRAVVALLTRRRKPGVESPLELPEGDGVPRSQLGRGQVEQIAGEDEDAAAPSQDEEAELAGRVRELAQHDLDLAANVVKLWLQESGARTT